MDVPTHMKHPMRMRLATLCLVTHLYTSAHHLAANTAMPAPTLLLVPTMVNWDGLARDIVTELSHPQILQLHTHLLKSVGGTMAHSQSPFYLGVMMASFFFI